MIDAVVYLSETGHSKQYAELLANSFNVKCYALDEAKKQLPKHSKIAYFGWLMAGFVQGYKKAKRRFDIAALCAVGMTPPSDSEHDRLAKQNHVKDGKALFMLLGGYEGEKLEGVHKMMMNAMGKGLVPKLEAKPDKNEMDCFMLDMFKNGKNCVSDEALAPVKAYLTK